MLYLNGQPLAYNTPFTHEGIQYPANWLINASQEERDAIGIEERSSGQLFDPRFYFGYNEEGELIPKPLEDEPEFTESGEPLLDTDGSPYMKKGLKSAWIEKQKRTAKELLIPTDWYVLRKAESGSDIPAEIALYREQVRSICGEREAEITSTSSVEELKELVTGPELLKTYEEDPDTGTLEEILVPNPNVLTSWPSNPA